MESKRFSISHKFAFNTVLNKIHSRHTHHEFTYLWSNSCQKFLLHMYITITVYVHLWLSGINHIKCWVGCKENGWQNRGAGCYLTGNKYVVEEMRWWNKFCDNMNWESWWRNDRNLKLYIDLQPQKPKDKNYWVPHTLISFFSFLLHTFVCCHLVGKWYLSITWIWQEYSPEKFQTAHNKIKLYE